jgi:prepilin-type N-terminal cleavage/methylation domain-containing protein
MTLLKRSPAAFSLIELIVVIAIIGVLIALLMPAVQKVRESANMTTCQNNLKQIGLAMHNYHDTQGSFPVGYYDPTLWPDPDNGPGWGWGAYLLPWLEQEGVYKQLQFDLDVGGTANATVRQTYLPIFICPSDQAPPTFTINDGGTNNWTLATGNYVACNGNDGVDDFTTPPHTGAFLRATVGFKAVDIRDGLSNTFFVGERTQRLSYSSWVGGPTGGLNPFLEDPGNSGAECTLVMFHAGPTGPNTPGVFDADSTQSPHQIGVQILMGDGAVRLIGNEIDIGLWMALATRAGEEPIPPDF